MKRDLDSGFGKPRVPAVRKSARVSIAAEVQLRRSGQNNYFVNVYDLSREGCKLEFVERPRLDEVVWVKFEGLDALQAMVCWVEGVSVGVEFERPIYGPVFDSLVDCLK